MNDTEMLEYDEFTKEMKFYNHDSIEDAAAAIYEDGLFDKPEAMRFIVRYEHKDEISKEEFDELCSKKERELEIIIKDILDENDGSDIFGHEEDDDTWSVDD